MVDGEMQSRVQKRTMDIGMRDEEPRDSKAIHSAEKKSSPNLRPMRLAATRVDLAQGESIMLIAALFGA